MTHPNTLSTMAHGEAISINIWHHTTPPPSTYKIEMASPSPLPGNGLFLYEKKKKE
jgi:hypothetical protein